MPSPAASNAAVFIKFSSPPRSISGQGGSHGRSASFGFGSLLMRAAVQETITCSRLGSSRDGYPVDIIPVAPDRTSFRSHPSPTMSKLISLFSKLRTASRCRQVGVLGKRVCNCSFLRGSSQASSPDPLPRTFSASHLRLATSVVGGINNAPPRKSSERASAGIDS